MIVMQTLSPHEAPFHHDSVETTLCCQRWGRLDGTSHTRRAACALAGALPCEVSLGRHCGLKEVCDNLLGQETTSVLDTPEPRKGHLYPRIQSVATYLVLLCSSSWPGGHSGYKAVGPQHKALSPWQQVGATDGETSTSTSHSQAATLHISRDSHRLDTVPWAPRAGQPRGLSCHCPWPQHDRSTRPPAPALGVVKDAERKSVPAKQLQPLWGGQGVLGERYLDPRWLLLNVKWQRSC